MSAEALHMLAHGQRRALAELMRRNGLNLAEAQVSLLCGDGSDRMFLRLQAPGWRRIAVLPAPKMVRGLAEAASFWQIGRHLRSRGVPVPEFYGFDPDTGLVLCEDLGDGLLQEKLQGMKSAATEIIRLYRLALDLLLEMQLEGAEGFDQSWCWDTGSYDRHLMLSRESGYFWGACCRDLLGLAKPAGLEVEFEELAELAWLQPSGFFLHRDYQSRNLLVQEDRLRILDFQGGRLGPLGYDLAALLNDPYASLPEPLKAELFEYYRQNLAATRPDLVRPFVEGYLWLALQRNLQVLGAFAFLSGIKGKSFFRGFLRPAAENLQRLLHLPEAFRFPVLRGLAAELPDRLDQVVKK